MTDIESIQQSTHVETKVGEGKWKERKQATDRKKSDSDKQVTVTNRLMTT